MRNTSTTLFVLLIVCLLNFQASVAFQTLSTSASLRTRPQNQIRHVHHFERTLHYRDDSHDDNIDEGDQTSVTAESTKLAAKQEKDLETGVSFDFSSFLPKNDDGTTKKLPPMRFEDVNLLFYDVFLIVNLSLSISFWVTHRVDFSYLPSALNEGCIFSVFWILSGLYHGAFLMSAVDGHYGSSDERSGPKAAAALGLNTYVNAVNMRLVFALVSAALHHRPVGGDPIEELIPLEIGCGTFLMTSWRGLHSYVTPRI